MTAPAAPDCPGDRDQQQAAEECFPGYGYYEGRCGTHGGRITRCDAALAAAREAARAEADARWQAKIEALIAWAKTDGRADVYWISRLRAVLDGEQR